MVAGVCAGLVSAAGRWTMSKAAGEATPDGMQRLLNAAGECDGARDDVRAYIRRRRRHRQAIVDHHHLRPRPRPAPRTRSASAYCSRVDSECSATCCPARLPRAPASRPHAHPGRAAHRAHPRVDSGGGPAAGAHPGALAPARHARLGRGRGTAGRGRRPSRAPGDRLLQPRRQLRLPGQPGEVSGSLRRARPAAPAAGSRAGCGGPRRRIQLPHPDPRTRQRRPRSHAPRRAACHGGRPQPRPSRTNRRPPPTPDGQGRCLAGTAAALVGAAAARWTLIRAGAAGEAAPVHQESAAYCAGGGTGVAVILI